MENLTQDNTLSSGDSPHTFTNDILIPSAADAEKILISGAIQNPDFLAEVGSLKEGFTRAHRLIVEAAETVTLSGAQADVVSVTTSLSGSGKLEEVGGAGYVIGLVDAMPIPNRQNFDYYFAAVKSFHLERAKAYAIEHIVRKQKANLDYAGDALELWELVECGLEKPKRRGTLPDVEDAAQWCNVPMDLPPAVIGGVLRMRAKMVLGGAAKTRKSWNLIQLALSLASGREYIGFQCRKSKVLFLNFELCPAEMHHRINSVAHAMECGVDGLHVWNLLGYAAGLEALAQDIIERALEVGAEVVILDPIYCVANSNC